MRHPFEDLLPNVIHADIFRKEYLIDGRLNLVENVRWRPDKPNRVGRYLPEIVEMIKDYGNVFIAYDLSHAHINGEPLEEILRYGDKIKMFHINDTIGKKDLHLTPMKGEIDYVKFFEILDKIQFKGILWIEP
jgi:sugar phosphate isomerase/epimerase